MKRFLSLLLAIVMVVSLLPLDSLAAQETSVTSYLAFTADVHNGSNNQAANRVNTWINNVTARTGRNIDVMSFCGDNGTASAGESDFWTYTQSVMNAVNNNGHVDDTVFVPGNHEHYNGNFNSTSNSAAMSFKRIGEAKNTDDYIIYAFGPKNWEGGRDQFYSDDLSTLDSYLGSLSSADRQKPIFILSHFPAHSFSGSGGWGFGGRSTANSDQLISTLNKYGDQGYDIYFLWGHNHTVSDTYYDEVITGSLDGTAISFTYLAAGCMSDSEYSTGSAFVKGKGLLVGIENRQVVSIAYYDANGNDVTEGSGSVTPATPEIAVTPTTDTPESSAAIAVGETLTIRVNNPSSSSAYDFAASLSNNSIAQIVGNETVSIAPAGEGIFTVKGLKDGAVDVTITNNGAYAERKAIVHLTVGTGGVTPTPCTHPNTAVVGAKAAACTEAGYTGDIVCVECGEVIQAGETIPPLGHDWGEWIVTKEASATEAGEKMRTCSVCGERETQEIPIPDTAFEVLVTPSTEFPEVSSWIAVNGTLTIRVTNGATRTPYDFTASLSNSGVAQIQGSETVNIAAAGEGTFTVKGLADGNVDITISNNFSYGDQLSRKAVIHLTVGNGGVTPMPCTHPNTAVSGAKAATCTEAGYSGDIVCVECGEVIQTGETIPPLGHAWDNGVITTAPACTTAGVMTYTCMHDASHTKTETIPPLGHDWGEWTVTVPAGDTTPGEESRTCSRCYEMETREIEPANAPTYYLTDFLVDGAKYLIVSTDLNGAAYALTNPGGSSSGSPMGSTEVTIADGKITASGSNLVWTATANGDWFDLTNEGGYLEGKSGSVKVYSPQQYPSRAWTYTDGHLEHVGGAYTYEVYYENGFTARNFNSSGSALHTVYLFVQEGSALPCQHEDLIMIAGLQPTCTEVGFEAYWQCSGCAKLFSDAEGKLEIISPVSIPPLGHAWDSGVVTTAPTCTTAGVMTYTCMHDASHTRTETIAPLDHDWGEWIVTVPAGDTTPGEETRTCSRCGETEEREIPAPAIVASGTCGENLTWTLDENGLLTISGTGEMADYDDSHNQSPWYAQSAPIHSVFVENGVTSIGDHAFENITALTIMTLPDSVTSIGEKAFHGCSGLSGALTLPPNLTSIGEGAFWGCSSLTGDLRIPEGVTEISINAFRGCSGFDGRLILPPRVQSVELYAFFGCSGFTGELVLPESMTLISLSSFESCSGFTGSLSLPTNLCGIGGTAFRNCTGFAGEIVIPDGIEVLSMSVFDGMSRITSLVLGEGIQEIYPNVDSGSIALQQIKFLSTSAPYIDSRNPFADMQNLKQITVPQSAYDDYVAALSPYLPEGAEIVPDGALARVQGLTVDRVYSKTAALSWDADADGVIAGYKVLRDGAEIGDVTDCAFVDRALEPGLTYTYTVRGYAADGRVTLPATIEVTTAEPRVTDIQTENSLNKIGLTNNTVTIYAADTNNLLPLGEERTTGELYYVVDGHRSRIGEAQLGENGVYTIHWDVTDVQDGEYTLVFVLTDVDGSSDEYSEKVTVDRTRPAKIVGVAAIADETVIHLTWSISAEVETSRYNIYRRAEDEDTFRRLTQITSRNTLSYTDSSVEKGKVYEYYVVGVNAVDVESAEYDVVGAALLDDTAAPTVTRLIPANATYLTGRKDLGIRAEDNVSVTRSAIYYSLDGGESWTLVDERSGGEWSASFDTTALPDGEMRVKGVAFDAAGNESDPLVYVYSIDNTGPARVEGVTWESTSVTATLRWNDVADDDLRFYRVERLQSDGTYALVTDVNGTLGANLYNLAPETSYTYRVVGYDLRGNRGVPSEDVTVTTQADTTSPVITSIRPLSGSYNTSIPVVLKASDEYGVQRIVLQTSADGVEWTNAAEQTYTTVQKDRTWSCTLSLADYAEGALYVRGVAADFAGNESDTGETAPFVQHLVDKTAPAAPQQVAARGDNGYVEISWVQGPEPDLNTYTVWRADAENGSFTAIASGIRAINCFDRNAAAGVTYWYYVTVTDKTGNVSAASETVSAAALTDDEPPEIVSIYPASGEAVGAGYRTVSVLARDNRSLDRVVIEYSADGETFRTLKTGSNLNTYSTTVSAQIPLSGFSDGDTVWLRARAYDASGSVSEDAAANYVVDLTAPALSGAMAQYFDGGVTVQWTGGMENDLAGYRIYRRAADGSSYSLIAQRQAVSGQSRYSCTDYGISLAGAAYVYKIEAMDSCGNVRSVETSSVTVPDRTAPTPKLSCESVMEVGVEYVFDATASKDNQAIASWHFDFGDGTESREAAPIHVYNETGNYTVRLTVTDDEGNQAVLIKEIKVRDRTAVGSIRIHIADEYGKAVPNAPVYFDLGSDEQVVRGTDSAGNVTFTADVGRHIVGCVIADNEWLPVKKEVIVTAGETTTVSMTLVHHPMIEGQFEIKRMTLEEIVAAGIDVSNPENQHIVKVDVSVIYASQPISDSFLFNPNTNNIIARPTVITTPDNHQRQLTPVVIYSPSAVDDNEDWNSGSNLTIAYLDVPVEASFLKEFFDVKLHIINNAASTFSMTDNVITLNVPEGLTIVDAIGTESNATVMIPEITGQTTTTITWILRGDTAGSYPISADYSGVLAEFNEPIHAQFIAEDPIQVYGLDALKLIVELNSSLKYDQFYFNLSLQNKGGADMYLPTVNVVGDIVSTYLRKAEEEEAEDGAMLYGRTPEAELIEQTLSDSNGSKQRIQREETLQSLAPGMTYTRHYVVYDATGNDNEMLFREATLEIAEGYGVDVEIRVSDINPFMRTIPRNCAQDVDSMGTITIAFNSGIQLAGTGNLYLCDYDTDEVIETISLDESNLNQKIILFSTIFPKPETPGMLNSLTFSFSKGSILPGRHYYIRIDPGAIIPVGRGVEDEFVPIEGLSFDGVGKEEWSFSTSDLEHPDFSNPTDKIRQSLMHKLFSPLKAAILSLVDDGTDGTCYGMSYTVGAWRQRYQTLNAVSGGVNIQNLEMNSKADGSYYSFLEYIQLAHLFQYTYEKQNESREYENKFDKIYQAISDSVNGSNNQVIIGVYDENKTGHALYPVKILSETQNFIQVLVYDCNKPPREYLVDESYLSTLTFVKTEGIITGFSYLSYHTTMDISIIDPILDEVVRSPFYTGMFDICYLVSSRMAVNDDQLLEIRSLAGTQQSGNHLYWTNNESLTTALCENQNISITDGYQEISVSSSKQMNATLDIGSQTATVSTDSGEAYDYNVEFTSADGVTESECVTISGTANSEVVCSRNADGGIVAQKENDSLNDMTVTVTKGDVVLNTAEHFADGDHVMVAVDEDYGITFYEDHDADGEYETAVAEFEAPELKEGVCGENLTWSLKGGTLYIRGEGAMTDFVNDHYNPWTASKETIQRVSIEEGVTGIGANAFSGCTNLTEVWFCGTESQWSEVSIGSGNEPIQNAVIHFEEPYVCQHSYTSVVTLPTCVEQGYTTYTCELCGDSYVGDYFYALGHSWDEGAVTKQPTGSAEGVKTFTCTRCGELRTESIPKLANPFRDVPEGKFYFEPVLWAIYQDPQITTGVDASHFAPDRVCTRAHVVTFLWRANGCPEPTNLKSNYKDVKDTSKYYYKAVLWAAENGVTTGYADGTFRPDDECTRGQVVTFLWRAKGSPEPKIRLNPFQDVKSSAYYYKAVLWALESGVTQGRTASIFGPDDACTRAHVVTFLYRSMT